MPAEDEPRQRAALELEVGDGEGERDRVGLCGKDLVWEAVLRSVHAHEVDLVLLVVRRADRHDLLVDPLERLDAVGEVVEPHTVQTK